MSLEIWNNNLKKKKFEKSKFAKILVLDKLNKLFERQTFIFLNKNSVIYKDTKINFPSITFRQFYILLYLIKGESIINKIYLQRETFYRVNIVRITSI